LTSRPTFWRCHSIFRVMLDRRIRPAMTSSCDFETNSHRFSRRPPARIAESEATLGRLCKTTARQSVAAGSPCCKILHGHWSLLGVPPQAFSCSCQLCVVKLPYDRATYTPAHYPKASACEASDLGGEAIISLHGIPALLSSTRRTTSGADDNCHRPHSPFGGGVH
jgi:hypothetical protein